MSYQKMKLSQAPKLTREKPSRFESTPEWRALQKDIDKGLKPNEACVVIITPEDRKRYGIKGRRTIQRFLQRYLEERALEYVVKTIEREGSFIYSVQHTPVIAQTA